MSLLRRLRSSAVGRGLVAIIGAGYIVLTHATTRWTVEGAEVRDRLLTGEGRWLIGLWHSRILALPPEMKRNLSVHAIISNNKDGEIIAAVCRMFGVDALRGSSFDKAKNQDKGGREAFEGAMAILSREENAIVAITPDGPRGPRQRCQDGIAALSVATRTPVVPLTYSMRRGPFVNSWDRTLIPWPFNRGVIIFGEPMAPPPDTGPEAVEAHRQAIETVLNDLTRRADEMCGRVPVEPAGQAA